MRAGGAGHPPRLRQALGQVHELLAGAAYERVNDRYHRFMNEHGKGNAEGVATPQVVGEVSRRVIHKGAKFDFEMLTFTTPGGKVLQREAVRHPGAVVIVPILEEKGRTSVVMIRNRRLALGEILLECPAGTMGDHGDEDPAQTAGRELIEETGYKAERLHSLGWFYTTPGMTNEKMHAFAATGLTHVGQALEEDENITVEIVPAAKAAGFVADGTLRDAKSMLAITLAERAGLLGNVG